MSNRVERLAYKNGIECIFYLSQGNRHGLITGGTGSGKTYTLQKLVEIFSDAGTAVFLPDVKGDLTALIDPGGLPSNVVEVLKERGINEPGYKGLPVEYWTATENHHGQRISTRLSSFGVDLLSSVMNLNTNQSSVLISVFKLADDENIDLFTLNDLLEFIRYIFDDVKSLSKIYGSISTMSLSVIIRAIIRLQDLGFDAFFSEDEIYTTDFIRQCNEGRGVVNILQSVELVKTPELYGTVIMYLLKKLYDVLPEVGNLPTPKIAFFFDESHLIFNLQSKTINTTLENTVRLIRSKGVGVYFISQTPSDIPDAILGQLGSKIQHVLRASTPRDQRAVNAAADSMPQNPKIIMREELKQLAVGEAIISLLNEDGSSTMSERAYVLPPASKSGTIDEQRIIDNTEKSMLYLFYAGKDEVQYSKEQAIIAERSNKINTCFSFNDVLRLYKHDKREGIKAFFKWMW